MPPGRFYPAVRERQAGQREYLHRFINGSNSPLAHAAFANAIARFGDNQDAQPVLAKRAPQLDASANFHCTSVVLGVLRQDGCFAGVPPLLLDETPGGSAARNAIAAHWVELVGDL
jgi:hypothetical protein